MALKIRLARGGSKKRPYYHVVVADVRSARATAASSSVWATGTRCWPRTTPARVSLNQERIQHWLDNGALPTDRVARFMAEAGMMTRDARNNPNKAQPGKKAQERAAEKKQKEEDAAAAAAEAAAAPAEAAAAEEAAAE
jgi:small subunit ribosomal protein S16